MKPVAKRIRELEAMGYEVAGVAYDGTIILKSPAKPTHFTDAEIKGTIREMFARKGRVG